jgi:TIGR00266 family protein
MKYEILGDNLPVLSITMNRGDTVYSEPGGKSWYIGNIDIDTNTGGAKKMFGRLLSGEQLFRSRYQALEDNCHISFASSFPGTIVPYKLNGTNSIIAQKDSFLCMQEGVDLKIYNSGIKKGLFGGEGFFLQKFKGNGLVFLEIDGYCFEYDLKANEKIVVDTGLVAAFESSVSMNIETIKGVKNIFFGNEGIFNTTLTGPGKIYLQSMSIANLANIISPHLPLSENK